MPIEPALLLLALPAVLIGILLVLLIGRGMRWGIGLCAQSATLEWFYAYLVGLAAVTFCYAVLRTGGATVLWGLALVGAALVWSVRGERSRENQRVSFGPVGWLLVCGLLLCLLLFALLFWQPLTGESRVLWRDFQFYARLAGFIDASGWETSLPAIDKQAVGLRAPYHYFDLWLAALVGRLSGLKLIFAYNLVGTTLMMTALIAGSTALAERLGLRPWTARWMGFWPLILTAFLSLAALVWTHDLTAYGSYALLHHRKYVLLTCLALVMLLEWRAGRAATAMICGLAAVVTNFETSVGLFLVLGLYAVVELARPVRLRRRQTLEFLLLLAGLGVFFLVFYLDYLGSAGQVSSAFWATPPSGDGHSLRTSINILVGVALGMTTLVAPYFLILLAGEGYRSTRLRIGRALRSREALLIMTFLVVPTLIHAIAYTKPDAFQIRQTLTHPLLIVGCFALLLLAYRTANLAVRIAVIACWVLSFLFQARENAQPAYNTDASFWREYAAVLDEKPHQAMGFLRSSESYATSWDYNLAVEVPLGEACYLVDDYWPTCLNPEAAPLNTKGHWAAEEHQLIGMAPATQYFNERKAAGTFTSFQAARLDFCREQRIELIALDKDAQLDSLLSARVERVLVNEATGERLVVLRPWNLGPANR